ncbi:MAG: ABC transporter ATP-binding protein [Desulfobacteraceae bacterium]|nr:ABC transporter ATP-binding protein [Desulfobacteraceae bacterium]
MTFLEVKSLTKNFGGLTAVEDVTFDIKRGRFFSIIGPNGAGKSTIFRTIFGLLNLNEGDVRFLGESIVGLKPRDILNQGLAYVPQGRFTFPEMTVQENLEMSLFIKKIDTTQEINRIYSRFPVLYEKRKAKANELSGGMQQLMEMAGALLLMPRLLMLDEPSLGLAPKINTEIFNRVKKLNKEGITFLIIEQNIHALLKVAQRIYVLELGQNRFEGAAQELMTDKRLSTLYLGGE